MLKIIAILLNSIILGFAVYMGLTEGFGRIGTTDLIPLFMFYILPIINILALTQKKERWFRLFLKEKKETNKSMEEKIEES